MKTLMRNNSYYPTFPSLINDFFNGELFDDHLNTYLETGNRLPSVNILEKEDSFEIEVAAPGMNKKDFNLELDNNNLIISSKKENSEEDSNEDYTRKEFSYSSFSRSFRLPENKIELSKINAKYKNGILYVNLPKKEEAKVQPAKMIAIN